ncbi:hypothetical protein EJ02DRAFT_431606 [Clathrospora elynae]|uniref:N-acetyltransferase domain-containing protein n=1 Tax=Clathrospora elynae TaxID=706981 RepID=A0A6A5SYP5_9PLEO|nr:hypothetical protein EJ02DRAFT_431606 [Clathrospora elynae]
MNGLSNSAASHAHLQPRIHQASEFLSNPTLEQTIRHFVNEGYRYIAPKNRLRWESVNVGNRLPDSNSIPRQLGDRGFFAVIYDPDDDATPVACAATTPWKGDLEGYAASGEEEKGWEIKIVTTRVEWMKGGLAGRCVDAIIDELVRLEGEDGDRLGQKLKVWIHTVECVNGAFWKKRGWQDVRGYEKPVGDWGSKEGYRLLVLLKEVIIPSQQ